MTHIDRAIAKLCKPTPAVDWLLRAGPVVEKLNETSREREAGNGLPKDQIEGANL
jgi:hypothetical protein